MEMEDAGIVIAPRRIGSKWKLFTVTQRISGMAITVNNVRPMIKLLAEIRFAIISMGIDRIRNKGTAT